MGVLGADLPGELEHIAVSVAAEHARAYTATGEMRWPPALKPIDLSVQTRARAAGSVANNARVQRTQPRSCAKRQGSRSCFTTSRWMRNSAAVEDLEPSR